VVVKELTDSGNANKSGVKLGDQLQQVCAFVVAWMGMYIIHVHAMFGLDVEVLD
jgi:hypothetical protein